MSSDKESAYNNIEVKYPLASPPDQIMMGSLTRLISKIMQKTMFLYDAMLSEKRILFSGQKLQTDLIG